MRSFVASTVVSSTFVQRQKRYSSGGCYRERAHKLSSGCLVKRTQNGSTCTDTERKVQRENRSSKLKQEKEKLENNLLFLEIDNSFGQLQFLLG